MGNETERKLLIGTVLTPEEALYRIYQLLEDQSNGEDWANECQAIALQTLNGKNIKYKR